MLFFSEICIMHLLCVWSWQISPLNANLTGNCWNPGSGWGLAGEPGNHPKANPPTHSSVSQDCTCAWVWTSLSEGLSSVGANAANTHKSHICITDLTQMNIHASTCCNCVLMGIIIPKKIPKTENEHNLVLYESPKCR